MNVSSYWRKQTPGCVKTELWALHGNSKGHTVPAWHQPSKAFRA